MAERAAARSVASVVAAVLVAGLVGCAAQGPSRPVSPRSSTAAAAPRVPSFDHVVIVVEENKAADQVASAPFLARLARTGATFSDFRAETHPSQPNYLALWSGSTQGVRSDACPVDLGRTPSLGSQLIAAGHSVAAYAEDLPTAGYSGCGSRAYARKHDPLADFSATADARHDLPFSAFPTDYDRLPDVALVVPNLDHDMHNGTVAEGDRWLSTHLSGYASWAETHDSLLVVTFDEDNGTTANSVFTTFSGAHVRPGTSARPVDHVDLLHTVEAAFGLPQLGQAAPPITDVWR